MIKNRRVGTFTLGVVLFLMGVLLLLHMFFPALDYMLIFHLWPCIFIILGIEILVSLFWKKEDAYKYDFAAIAIIICMVIFTMVMASVDLVMTHDEIFHVVY